MCPADEAAAVGGRASSNPLLGQYSSKSVLAGKWDLTSSIEITLYEVSFVRSPLIPWRNTKNASNITRLRLGR